MDKEIILHIIDGPGTVWGWIAVAIVVGFVIVILTRTFNGYEVGYREGRTAERRDGLDQLRTQLAKITFDQQQIFKHLEYKEPAK